MSNQITKDQHIIPKFYFKKFSDNTGRLWVLDISKNKISKPVMWPQPCHEDFYFAVKTGIQDEASQLIETFLKEFEDLTSQNYDRIIEMIMNNDHIQEKDICILSKLAATLWVRSRIMRENIKINLEKVSDLLKLDKKRIEEIKNEENNIPHLKMIMNVEKYVNIFFDKKWRFFISNDGNFITSDNPVFDLFYSESERKIIKKFSQEKIHHLLLQPKVWLRDNILSRRQIFAISPNITAIIVPPDFSGKRTLRKRVETDCVELLNFLRANNSMDYCYSKNNNELNRMFNFRARAIDRLIF